MLNIGILGTGFIVPTHIETVKNVEGMQDLAICSTKRSYQKALDLAKKYNISKVYDDYEEMLNDKDIDAVYVAITNSAHFEQTKKALLAGKHVFLEKPFTHSYESAKELFKLADQQNVKLVEAITTMFLPSYLDIKKSLSELGQVKIVTTNFSQYSSRYDDFKQGVIKPAFDNHLAGGSLMDINIYNIHFVVGLFGMPERVEYYANIENNIDTSGILTLSYPGFYAVCTGAKDCTSPCGADIEGNSGISFHVDGPVSLLSQYDVYERRVCKETRTFNQNPLRMYDECVGFRNIVINNDTKRYSELKEHSLDVMKIVDQALTSANITFNL